MIMMIGGELSAVKCCRCMAVTCKCDYIWL